MKQENIKWRINQNLSAKKRKQAIYDLIENFELRDIKVIDEIDSYHVIIKIDKRGLMEREIK